MGEALAYLMGDRRDFPPQCGWCESTNLWPNHARQCFHCEDCHKDTTFFVAHIQREERARKHVMSGVGGPLVEAYEQRPKGKTG